VRPNMRTTCAGTFWLDTVVTDETLIDPESRLRTLCHVVPGQWMTEGVAFHHGFSMRWFRDGFCQEEKRLAAEQGTDAYVLMERLAQEVPPGANGVVGTFSDVMNAKKWRHAPPSLVGFTITDPAHSGKKESIRAIEEQAAYTTRGHYDIITELTGQKMREMTFAGGSSKGFLWPQIVADVLGVTVRIPKVREATSLGAAMCALLGIGEVKSWDEAVERVVHLDHVVEPNMETHATYEHLYERWRTVYRYMVALADDRVVPGLWRAPGI
jgi:autoinducer-2 kinase